MNRDYSFPAKPTHPNLGLSGGVDTAETNPSSTSSNTVSSVHIASSVRTLKRSKTVSDGTPYRPILNLKLPQPQQHTSATHSVAGRPSHNRNQHKSCDFTLSSSNSCDDLFAPPSGSLNLVELNSFSSKNSADRARARSRHRRVPLSSDASSLPPTSPSRWMPHQLLSPPLSPLSNKTATMFSTALDDRDSEQDHQYAKDRRRPASFSTGARRFPLIEALMATHLEELDDSASTAESSPGLVSPVSLLSRSTSLKSGRSDKYLSPASRLISSKNRSNRAILPSSHSDSQSDWSTRAQRWSSSMSQRINLSALNHTISSTTSPYLKAGFEELKSIFEIDTLGSYSETNDKTDFFKASNSRDLEGCSFDTKDADMVAQGSDENNQNGLGLYEVVQVLAPQRMHSKAKLADSPQQMSGPASPSRSRQQSASSTVLTSSGAFHCSDSLQRSNSGPSSQRKRAEKTVSDEAKEHIDQKKPSMPFSPNRSSGTLPSQGVGAETIFQHQRRSDLVVDGTSRLPKPAIVAVGLAATAIAVVSVCALETSMHPDAASLPLTAFMLAQPAFAVSGLIGLWIQKRWLMDLSSRLLRAHVLSQALIAATALRSLSRSAFYRPSATSIDSIVDFTELRSGRFKLTSPSSVHPQVSLDRHSSNVGSWSDQLTYTVVFLVQAALPLAIVLWAQYRIAMALGSLARKWSSSSSSPLSSHSHPKQHYYQLDHPQYQLPKHSPSAQASQPEDDPDDRHFRNASEQQPAPIHPIDPSDLLSRLETLQQQESV